ncbi:MAG: AarF/ABC1/UbiB kinase family protein, partial [Halobacteria archaeon]|nr:AarF/ABC1/UbiB kinase family protein [Halobacteria archaeon]
DTVKAAVRTPVKLEKVLDKIERNDLQVRAEVRDTRSYIDRLGKRLAYSILAGTLVISASILATIDILYGVPPLLGSFFFFVLLVISLRKGRGLRGEPQFTRHEMRKRRE